MENNTVTSMTMDEYVEYGMRQENWPNKIPPWLTERPEHADVKWRLGVRVIGPSGKIISPTEEGYREDLKRHWCYERAREIRERLLEISREQIALEDELRTVTGETWIPLDSSGNPVDMEELGKILRETLSQTRAAKAVVIPYGRWKTHRNSHSVFARFVEDALAEGKDDLEAEVVKRARDGNDLMLMFKMKQLDPSYKDRVVIDNRKQTINLWEQIVQGDGSGALGAGGRMQLGDGNGGQEDIGEVFRRYEDVIDGEYEESGDDSAAVG